MRTNGEAAQAAKAAIKNYQVQVAELEAEKSTAISHARVAQNELEHTLSMLAQQLLPSADASSLQRCQQLTGYSHLAGRRVEYEQKRAGWEARIAQIQADPRFRQRDQMLRPDTGTLATSVAQWRAHLSKQHEYLATFDIEPFQWLRNREAADTVTDKGAFHGFWRAVTFANARENKAKQQCCEALNFADYDSLYKAFTDTEAGIAESTHQLQQLEKQRAELVAMVEEYAELYDWTNHFEHHLLTALRNELAQAMAKADLIMLRKRLDPHMGALVSKAHGLLKKQEYLGNVGTFADKEIADRNKQINSIDRVRLGWAAKPHKYLSGDKTKWLITLPEMKRQSTSKKSRWLKRMSHSISVFDDWDDYDDYMYGSDDFCAYDAFAYCADEQLPYDGFAREVMHDVAHFREEHDQEKPDYSGFKEIDKQPDESEAADDSDADAEAALMAAEMGEMAEGS